MTTSAAPPRPHAGRTPRLLMLCCALMVAAAYATAFFLPVHSNRRTGWDIYRVVAAHAVWGDNSYFRGTTRLQALIWWAPNPLLWVGTVLLAIGRTSGATALGLLALPASLSVAFNIDVGHFRFDPYSRLRELRAGYYCWLASMAFLT